jgi:hypothetical protein
MEEIEGELRDPACDRSALCRRALTGLLFPQYASNWETAIEDSNLPLATRLTLSSTDPRNEFVEPEHLGALDRTA